MNKEEFGHWHIKQIVAKQARKSSEDTQVATYARFEKVWAQNISLSTFSLN